MTVEVRLSENFANVVLVPSAASGSSFLATLLERPRCPCETVAEGFIVESHQSHLLLDIPDLSVFVGLARRGITVKTESG